MKKMLKTLLVTASLALATAAITVPAYAETITSPNDWNVTFTRDAKMETNFNPNAITETVNNMQPGDTAEIAINLKNNNSEATNWYMLNKIISSLEDAVTTANGGAYSYDLKYISPNNQTTTLFSSEAVGGGNDTDVREGLNEINGGLDDYFLLGELSNGQSGKVTLAVALEGESQGNSYQDTLADLSMEFAVELVNSGPNRNPNYASLLQTGDQFLSNLPIYLCVAGVGLLILIIAIVGRRKKNKQNEEGVQ